MGAYDCSPNRGMPYGMDAARGPWDPAVDGGVGVGELTDRFSDMDVSGNSKESLFQVMKAVEDAENTIKFQLEENKRLKDELMQKDKELSRIRLNPATISKSSLNEARDEAVGPNKTYSSQWTENSSALGPTGTLVIHQDELTKKETNNAENLHYPDNRVNGSLKASSSGQAAFYHTGVSQFSTPSSRSISPNRHHKEGEYDPITSTSGHDQMNNSDGHNPNSLWKQDLIRKIREHEEEILQLKRHLADYSVKEEKIRNEKYVLEKRIAHMRMAFDQQQQELVDAASKALSYRQDIIEENIRLTYALQSAQQERSTFVSSLLPLLSEYNLQPPTSDANSIVSNLKVLFRHLHEKLIITEEKLKETQYQITPWRAEVSNNSNYAPQSPPHSFGVSRHGLEIVPQSTYNHAHSPISSPLNAQTRADWEPLGLQTQHMNPHGFTKNEHENIGRSSPGNRNPSGEDVASVDPVATEDSHPVHFASEAKESFNVHHEMEDSEGGPHSARQSSTQWASNGSPYMATPAIDDNTSYPYLPTVLEEPTSSLSEAAEDDPLPGIEGLQISGDAYPGRDLQACGYSINGTTSCNFEWVRYLEDGSVNYIEGAKQPTYLVTADDVDSYLAIEVQPLDNRKRKGDLVKVYANEQKKITCDPDMQDHIQKILSVGHESFDVSISAGVLDIWENAVLAIKAEGYSIKCSGPRGIVVAEKFSNAIEINIPYGLPTEISIESGGVEYRLRTNNNSPPRDTIVLVLRLFKMRAVEKKKSRKKVRFFK